MPRWDDRLGRYDDPEPDHYLIGVDLGQARDFTAVAVIERRPDPLGKAEYLVNHLERTRGVAYPKIVAHIGQLLTVLDARRPRPTLDLVLDATGVGTPVLDLFREADYPGSLTGVLIHGGESVSRDGDVWRVPKRTLASVIQVLLQSGRLGISDQLTLASVLTAELANFRAKISLAGHPSFGAGDDWRSENHDDLVLSVAMACWYGEQGGSGRFEAVPDEVAAVLREMGL